MVLIDIIEIFNYVLCINNNNNYVVVVVVYVVYGYRLSQWEQDSNWQCLC